MKKYISKLCIPFLAVVLLVQCNSKKDGYKITGELSPDAKIDTIYLYDNGLKKMDSAVVKNGKFTLTGKVDAPIKAFLGKLDPQIHYQFVLENADYQFKKEDDNYVIKGGGEFQNLIFGYKNASEYREVYSTLNQLFQKKEKETQGEKVDEINKELDKYSNKLESFANENTKKILNGNYSDHIKLLALVFVDNYEIWSVDEQLALLDNYEKKLGKSNMATEHRKYLESMNEIMEKLNSEDDYTPDVGEKFIDGELMDVEGKSLKLSSVISKHRYTLVDFWASWCENCRDQFPDMKKQYNNLKENDIEIITVSVDDRDKDWRRAMQIDNMPWPNFIVPKAFESPMIKEYGILAVPTSFLISREGIIVAKTQELRGENLKKTLDKYLK